MELQIQRDQAKAEALKSPLQGEIESLRDQIVAARRKGQNPEALKAKRDALKAERDAHIQPLVLQVAQAKRDARREALESTRKACEHMTDAALQEAMDEQLEEFGRVRKAIKALAAEAARRAQKAEVKSLVDKLSPEERAALKAELA